MNQQQRDQRRGTAVFWLIVAGCGAWSILQCLWLMEMFGVS